MYIWLYFKNSEKLKKVFVHIEKSFKCSILSRRLPVSPRSLIKYLSPKPNWLIHKGSIGYQEMTDKDIGLIIDDSGRLALWFKGSSLFTGRLIASSDLVGRHSYWLISRSILNIFHHEFVMKGKFKIIIYRLWFSMLNVYMFMSDVKF